MMTDWRETLNHLHQQGWDYRVSSFYDCGVGKTLYLLTATQGGVGFKGVGETLPVAVENLVEALGQAEAGEAWWSPDKNQ